MKEPVPTGQITIGDAARATGVSAKAVRLWEAKGLLRGIERTPAGYRQFRDSDLAVMRFIRQAQQLGMTLDDVKSILDMQRAGETPCGRVTQVLDARIAEIDRAMDDLAQLRQSLAMARKEAAERTGGENAAGVCPIIEGRSAKAQRAAP